MKRAHHKLARPVGLVPIQRRASETTEEPPDDAMGFRSLLSRLANSLDDDSPRIDRDARRLCLASACSRAACSWTVRLRSRDAW